MDILHKPPEWLIRLLPEGGVRDFFESWGWYVVLALVGLLVLLILSSLVKRMFGGQRSTPAGKSPLEENLGDYPPLAASTGDRQLRVEGVPVRLRLVVVAPAGNDADVDIDEADNLLERILPGLGEFRKGDKARVKVWPRQLSYEGFTKHFQRNMITPEGEGEPSRWVLLGGRAKLGKQQIMLGLALQAIKPTTIGRRTLEAHEWPTVLRVRVRE